MSAITQSLFQSSLMLYIPLSLAVVFAIVFIPSLLSADAKPEGIARAISSYILQTIGVIVLALSAIQLTYALITMQLPELPTLYALILLFCLGIGILVHQSKKVAEIEEASALVPHLIFVHTLEIVGSLVALVSGLSVIITFIVSKNFMGWQMSATMFLLGVTLMMLSSVHIEKRNKKVRRVIKKKR